MPTPSVVLVTGASTGFGRLIAETLARHGYRTFATMRDAQGRNAPRAAEIHALAEREKIPLSVLELDVTSDAGVERCVEMVIDQAGRVDVVVNNAGYGVMGMTEASPIDQVQRIFDTNVLGAMRVNRAVLPHMRRQRSGLLIHIASGAGRVVVPAMGLYCASKWALEAISETYRYELATFGVDSVVIEPGAYPTAVFGNLEKPADAAREAEYGDVATLGDRVFKVLTASKADPQEIADAVLATIRTPFGERKARQRVSSSTGVDGINALNDLSAQLQKQLIAGFGLADITTS